MHDTHTQTVTRHCKTNNCHSHLTLTANQIHTDNSKRTAHLRQKTINDNNSNRQNFDKNNRDSKLKYDWGADDEIMKNINRRDNSQIPESLPKGELN